MNKEDVYEAIDYLREQPRFPVIENMCNYVEANIDDFVDCYKKEYDE